MQLYEHQKKIISEDKLWSGLWLGCGSGKTRIALSLAEGDTLVICEKQQRDEEIWQKEMAEMGINKKITVISKEDFQLDKFEYRRYDTLILDEATWAMGVRSTERQKNYVRYPDTSKTFLKLKSFIEDIKPKRFYPVTATVTKTPLTVFAAGVLLGYLDMPQYYNFREAFYFQLPMRSYTPIYSVRKGTEERLAVLVNKLGYTGKLSDWNDVPEQTYITKKVDLTADQKRYLKEELMHYETPSAKNAKRHQIESGVLLGNEYQEDVFIKDNKIEAVLDYAIQFDRLIVVAKWTKQIEKLKEAIPEAYVLNGQTKNRKELNEKLKSSDKYVLIVQAGISKGWSLPHCEAIVFASNDYKWEDWDQMHGRIQRANNIKKNVYVNIITDYKESMDKRVLKRLETGEDFNDAL